MANYTNTCKNKINPQNRVDYKLQPTTTLLRFHTSVSGGARNLWLVLSVLTSHIGSASILSFHKMLYSIKLYNVN